MTTPQQIDRAKRDYGFFLELCGPPGNYLVLIPCGVDPQDGKALHMARLARPAEVVLWEAGNLEALALMVQPPCRPMAPPRGGAWGRFVRGVRKAMGLSS